MSLPSDFSNPTSSSMPVNGGLHLDLWTTNRESPLESTGTAHWGGAPKTDPLNPVGFSNWWERVLQTQDQNLRKRDEGKALVERMRKLNRVYGKETSPGDSLPFIEEIEAGIEPRVEIAVAQICNFIFCSMEERFAAGKKWTSGEVRLALKKPNPSGKPFGYNNGMPPLLPEYYYEVGGRSAAYHLGKLEKKMQRAFLDRVVSRVSQMVKENLTQQGIEQGIHFHVLWRKDLIYRIAFRAWLEPSETEHIRCIRRFNRFWRALSEERRNVTLLSLVEMSAL